VTVRDVLRAICATVNQEVGDQGEAESTAAPGLTGLTEVDRVMLAIRVQHAEMQHMASQEVKLQMSGKALACDGS
jgi:hypothetical protein